MAPGLYVHVPFCSSICPYCDFSVMHAASTARRRFASRLVAEVSLAAAAWRDPRPFDTVYFGGGTPSRLASEELARVLDACRRHLAFATPAPWVFLEANPEDVTLETCAAWRALGVRTLSLGVQSFSDETLFLSMCRAAGLPARYAGSIAIRGDDASLDDVFHCWAEVYLPNYGWIPVDPSGGDSPSPEAQADYIGHLANRYLITTQGGGNSKYLTWTYNSDAKWTMQGKCKIFVETIGEWNPIRAEEAKKQVEMSGREGV